MASDYEEQSYSSPPKRLKLDESSSLLCNSSIDVDSVPFIASSNSMELSSDNTLKITSEDIFIKSDEEKAFPDLILSNSQSSTSGLDIIHLGTDDEDEDDDDQDKASSTVSNLSVLSGLSNGRGRDKYDCKDGLKITTSEDMFSNSGEEKAFPDLILSNSQSSTSGLDMIGLCSDDDDDEDEDEDDDDDQDKASSTVSNLSDLSGLSNISGQDWKGIAGRISWVRKQMINGVNPRNLLSNLMGDKFTEDLLNFDDVSLWKIIVQLLSEPPRRVKLRHINTLDDVLHLLKTCSRIVVLTGAGVSVSCGIPDFRSRDGVYSRLAVDFPDLPDPQAMFDINYFKRDPRPFFKFAREIYPGQFKPSPCHRFIKALEENNKLLRNYTQNIDTLERVAGIKNVVECHGSFATASCTVCGFKVTSGDLRKAVFLQKVPLCPKCNNATHKNKAGVMKPDIVFFGEGLPESFHKALAKDKDECDLLIVIGSSLKVRPVALIPSSLPSNVPQVLINRERLPYMNFDVELLGDGDIIIDQLCRMMGEDWSNVCWRSSIQTETSHLLPPPCRSGYNTEYSENEADIWLRKCDNLPQTDNNMEAEEIVGGHLSSDDSCDCEQGASQMSVKCRKIRRIKSRSKSPVERTEEGSSNSQTQPFGPAEPPDVRMSIEQEDSEGHACLVGRRHLSMDSTRDSGIGDGSNSSLSAERHMSVDSQSDAMPNLASRLPENTYYFIRPNRYIFQGAEVIDESDDSASDSDSKMNGLDIEQSDEIENDALEEISCRPWSPSPSLPQLS